MTPEQAAAYVQSQTACLIGEIEAMKALNAHRESQGVAQAYNEAAFTEVVERSGLGYNDVVGFFQEVNEYHNRGFNNG